MTRLRLVGMDTLGEAYGLWLRDQDLTPNTIYQRQRMMIRLGERFDLATVGPGDLSDWSAAYDGWTRAAYVAGARSIMAFMVDTGRRGDDPTKALRRQVPPKPRPRPLEPDDTTRLLLAALGVERTWCMFGLHAGLRAHEVAKLRGEDITESRLRVHGKGGKVAYLPTHPSLWAVAQSYPRSGWWFPSRSAGGHITSKWISARTSILLAGIGADGSFHRLRATFGTTLLRNGANIKVVQELMRHSSLASTEHYLGVAQDELTTAIRSLLAA